jgi:hypothetical protein
MLKADQAPYFQTCPRCGIGGLERLTTHAFCVNCNYEEIYSDELCAIPQWALDAVKAAAKKNRVHSLRQISVEQAASVSNETTDDGSAA